MTKTELAEKLIRLYRRRVAAARDVYSAPNYRQSELRAIQDEIDEARARLAELEDKNHE